ncbi:MAG: LamG-like jellyroll fold domain-containing protein, partial [Pirellulaceae bacterium]
PSFARRSPSSVTTRPSPDLQSHKYGLVFDGSSRLEIPVPPELDRPGQPFTVEMWVRFAYAETPATLLRCGKLKLTYTPNIVGSPEPAGLRLAVGDQTTGTDSSLAAGRFHHLAITSDGQRGQLVVNGNVLSGQQLSGIRERGRGPVHVGLDPQSQVGLRGIVRGVRVSSVNRYPQRLPASELPKILVADDHSLVALDFQVERGDELRDLAGAPENGRKIGAVWVPLDYFGEYAAEKNWGTVDLMRTFLADHHTLEGETHQTQSELVLKAESGRNVVLVPHLPPENYRFEAAAQRTQGEGGLMIGLVLGGHPAVLCIDGKLGSTRVTGLMTAQGQVLPSTRPLSCPSFDAAGAPRKLHCEVFTKGELASVRLLVDGQAAYEWTGPAAAAAAGSQWQIPCQTLFVGSSEAAFSLREMTLQRLSSSPANLVAAADGPPNPRTGPNTAPLPGTGSFTRERLPVPSQETLDAELAKAWAIYDADWKKATKPLQKATLAKGVLKSGAETTGDPTARYVLIEVARQMFVAAGEVNAALGAARQLEGDFSIPVHQAVAATLVELEKSSLPPEERGQFAKAAIDLADAMLAAADFERADEISAMAVQSVARLKDADLKKDVALRRAEVVGVVKQWNLIEASREALAQTPADPAANLAVGKFYCLVMEDWAKGLAHLASSGDSPFAAAAQLDGKSSKGDAAAGYAAAQAWAKLADDPKAGDREQRLALQRRAKLLLEASLVNLDGLDKVNAQKLMDKLQDVAAKAERGTDPRATADRPGLVGRVMARSKDAGVLITYEPDYLLTRDDLEKVRMAAGVQAGEPWQIMFHGMLTLPTDSRVEVWHAGGSAAGGVHTIFVGEKKVENEVGGNRSNNRITYIPVLRGQHAVLWVLSGVDMGTAGMRLTPTDASGQSLDHRTALIATRDLINKARRIPTKAELQFP